MYLISYFYISFKVSGSETHRQIHSVLQRYTLQWCQIRWLTVHKIGHCTLKDKWHGRMLLFFQIPFTPRRQCFLFGKELQKKTQKIKIHFPPNLPSEIGFYVLFYGVFIDIMTCMMKTNYADVIYHLKHSCLKRNQMLKGCIQSSSYYYFILCYCKINMIYWDIRMISVF